MPLLESQLAASPGGPPASPPPRGEAWSPSQCSHLGDLTRLHEEDGFLIALVAGSLFSSLSAVKRKDVCLSAYVKKSSSPQEAGLRTRNSLGKKAQSLEGERAP